MTLSIYSPNESIFNHSYQDWIAEFWNTFQQKDIVRRQGPVYCVPGAIPETGKQQEKTNFLIGEEKAILLSPMNIIKFTKDDKKYHTGDKMQLLSNHLCGLAAMAMDGVQKTDISLDGQDIKDKLVRVASGMFKLDRKYYAASEGYWLFLKPNSLEEGRHIINTFAVCSSGRTQFPQHWILDIKGKLNVAAGADVIFGAK
jgi:hypothetical protein